MTPKTHTVSRSDAGRTVGAIVKAWQKLTWSQARARVAAGQILVNGHVCTDWARRIRMHDRVSEKPEAKRTANRIRAAPAPAINRRSAADETAVLVVHSDRDVIVVDKPAGITTMRHATEAAEFGDRGRRFLPATLEDRLRRMCPGPILAVHRIDRDTSGLVVFARNAEAALHLGHQFRVHSVKRQYLALVRGPPVNGRIESRLVADRGDGRRGSSTGRSGKRAVTHVRLVDSFGDCALIECRLETGRTHQIRIHLGEAGAPLAGETIYDRPIHGAPAPDRSGSPRLALHAASIGFVHPRSESWMEWHSELPPDLKAVIRRLRNQSDRSANREM